MSSYDEKYIHAPVSEYVKEYRDRHEKVVTDYFDDLAKQAGVDVDANKETVRKYRHELAMCADLTKKLKRFKGLKAFLIVLIVLAFIAGGGLIYYSIMMGGGILILWALLAGIGSVLLAVGLILIVCLVVNKKIKILKSGADTHKVAAEQLLAEAWKQMHPLNRLFNIDISTKLVNKTAPIFKFDPYFDAERLGLLATKYGLNNNLGKDYSVLCLKSGELAGSPFLLAKILRHVMGTKTYHGSLTITWTETYYDSSGNRSTRTRSETLHASVTKPYPEYYTSTKFIFGNEAAPDLEFSREPSGLDAKNEKNLDKWVAKQEKKLDKVAKNNNFQKMSNTEFEVIFGAYDRNHDVQFRLLFTPLAQTEMVKLITDGTVGYGDDFYFDKMGMLNMITPNHANQFDFTGSSEIYQHYEFTEIARRFKSYNCEFFRQLYFSAAPILAIPLYQDHKPLEKIYKDVYGGYLATWQQEAVANSLPIAGLQHPESITRNILKTQFLRKVDDGDLFNVYCSGFKGIERVDYVTVHGGDGYNHSVPVYWTEYIPVMEMSEVVCKVDTKQKYNTQHVYQIFERFSSYLGGRGIQTAGSYFSPSMYAFIQGGKDNRIASTPLDQILGQNDENKK